MLIELFGINISENTKMLADSTFFANLPSTGIWNAKKFPGGTAIWPFTGSKSSSTNTGGKIIVRQYGKGRFFNGYKYVCNADGSCMCKQAPGAVTPYGTIANCISENPTKMPSLTVSKNKGPVNKLGNTGIRLCHDSEGNEIGYNHGWNIQCYSYATQPCQCISLPGCQPFSSQEVCQLRLTSFKNR